MTTHGSSVPLADALPWTSPPTFQGRSFLVTDSIETDGRFLLHTYASQILNAKEGQVLWLACGPWTASLVASALKRIGCEETFRDEASSSSSSDESTFSHHPLHIHSVTTELSRICRQSVMDDTEGYAKSLYQRSSAWIKGSDSSKPCLVVIDDVSGLGSLLGERLAYILVASLIRLTRKRAGRRVGLLMRCSADTEQESVETNAPSVHPSRKAAWVGAGGVEKNHRERGPSWESQLAEFCDGIVDVLPLTSGYSREAHGRLVFTVPCLGKGWGTTRTTDTPLVMNYCLQETTISAILIKSPISGPG